MLRRAGFVGIAIACGACGRIGFDLVGGDVPDAIGGHDEDEDGVADIDDVCPHLVGSQADTDGDRIGDDCDPEPGNPRQALLLFATMQPGDQPLTMTRGTWTQNADSVSLGPLDGGRLARTIAVGDFRMAVGVDIESEIGATLQHQVGLGAQGLGFTNYFVELNEGPGYNRAGITYFDGASYQPQTFQMLNPSFHPGHVVLQATQIASTRTVEMDGGWGGEPYHLTVPAPNYAGGTEVQVFMTNVTGTVHYVWIIGW